MAEYDTSRTFDAPVSAVYRAFTDPTAFAKWGCGTLYDNIALDIDPREGGVIHHRVRSKDNGSEWTFFGVYHEVEVNRRLCYTFDWKQDWREPPTPSQVELEFEDAGGTTRLHLRHAQVPEPVLPSTKAHWTDFLDVLTDRLNAGEIGG